MGRHLWGIHLPNGDMDLGTHIDTIGDGCYTLLHDQAHVLQELRRRCPHALILVRCYVRNWAERSPESWAAECAAIYEGIKPYTNHITWANEQNLRDESGGTYGAPGIQESDYHAINDWNYRWITAFNADPRTAGAILHYPAFASGHSDDQNDYGYVGLEICRPSIQRCHVLDRHYYTSLDRPIDDLWNGTTRITLAQKLFPNMPIFISETGNFATSDPRTPDHYMQVGYQWQGMSGILGFTWFIAADPTHAHAQNDMSKNPGIAEAIRKAVKIDIPIEPIYSTGAVYTVDSSAPIPSNGLPIKPPPPPPPVDSHNIGLILDTLWASATALEQANYPWTGQGIKAMIALLKGEK